jgi:hypothetical protein
MDTNSFPQNCFYEKDRFLKFPTTHMQLSYKQISLTYWRIFLLNKSANPFEYEMDLWGTLNYDLVILHASITLSK